MMNATEALKGIQAAEQKAHKLVEESKRKAEDLLHYTNLEIKEQHNQLILEGKEQAEGIKQEATLQGKKLVDDIMLKGKKEANSLRNLDQKKIDTVVKSIVKEIVSNYGNR